LAPDCPFRWIADPRLGLIVYDAGLGHSLPTIDTLVCAMTLVLPLVLFELWLLLLLRRKDWRRSLVEAVVAWAVLLLAVSEALSAVRAFAQVPLFLTWTAVALALLWPIRRAFPQLRALASRPETRSWSLDVASSALILCFGITLVIALVAPPNTTDSLTYHLGRVAEWLDNRSIAHFATHVERQVALGPFAEIVIANLQALSGGDRFANLVQWGAFVLSATTASMLVQELGGDVRAQKLAAVLVATIPMAILQATSTQNDLVCAFFVATAALYCISLKGDFGSGAVMGAAGGLALLTKGTAPVFLAPFSIWALFRLADLRRPRRALAIVGLAGAMVLAINTAQWVRNQKVFGNPLGPRWIARMVGNDVHGIGPTYSNLIRNGVSHIGLLDVRMRAPVLAAVAGLHKVVGLDMNDPRTTLAGKFSTADLSRHEDSAPNTAPILLFLGATVVIAWRGTRRQRWFWLVVSSGFVLYGAMFKWQPWGSRLHTPFFILAAVPTALALQMALRGRLQRVAVVTLVLFASPWLVANATRSLVPSAALPPILAASDIWTKSRLEQYSVNRPDDYRRFAALTEQIRAHGCAHVGVLGDGDSWTYPLHVLLHQANDRVKLRPVLVRNPTAALSRPGPDPCALASLAFGRIHGPENTPFDRFRLVWHDGQLALYLPEGATEP